MLFLLELLFMIRIVKRMFKMSVRALVLPWVCEEARKGEFSITDTKKKKVFREWLHLRATDLCVRASSECVNSFSMVAVAGPPSCFSPHIITILLCYSPFGDTTLLPLYIPVWSRLQRASHFYRQLPHTRYTLVLAYISHHKDVSIHGATCVQ